MGLLRLIFLCCSFGFTIVGGVFFLMPSEKEVLSRDVMIMLDVSTSMNVEDMPGSEGNISRLDAAKAHIATLIFAGVGERVGLGIFAGTAEGVMPLTYDRALVSNFLTTIQETRRVVGGTNLASALTYAAKRFVDGRRGVVVLYTDGGETKDSLQDIRGRADEHTSHDVLVVGVGSELGGPIPVSIDLAGKPVYKTYQGSVIQSTLEKDLLQEVASRVDGAYYALEYADLEIIEFLRTNTGSKNDEGGTEFSALGYIGSGAALFCFVGFLITSLLLSRKPDAS